jgi:hypothetical protein
MRVGWRDSYVAARGEPGRGAASFNVNDLAGLRSGNHVFEVGVFIGRCGIVALFNFALGAAMLLVLLLLFTGLLSAAFFQLVVLLTWPKLSVPFVAGAKETVIRVR